MNERELSGKYKIKIVSFYCLIILMLLGWIGLSVLFAFWILSFGSSSGRLFVLALLPVLYALFAIVVFLTYKPYRVKGISVTRHTAPQLFELIESSAKRVGFEGHIEDVALTPGMSVSVYYDPNLFNFFIGSNAKLYIGVSLCNALSKDELCAVIGHELAHFAQPQTKYKAYLARISNITSRLGRNGVFGSDDGFNPAFFSLYAWPAHLFCRCFTYVFETIFDVNSSDYLEVTADMEMEADKVAAHAFGSGKMLSALCKSSGISDRLILYKLLILPYLSSLGYRCDGFWKTFESTSPLFMAIDGLEINDNQPLLGLNRTQFDLSECVLALRLEALENLSSEPVISNTTSKPSIDVIPDTIVSKMDDFLCWKYGQTTGIKVGRIRYNEIINNLRNGLFANVHSMNEAFVVVKELFEEMQSNKSGVSQIFMPESEDPSCDVVPQSIIRQASEVIYSSDMEYCPVCGHEVSNEAKVCPHCHEIISE